MKTLLVCGLLVAVLLATVTAADNEVDPLVDALLRGPSRKQETFSNVEAEVEEYLKSKHDEKAALTDSKKTEVDALVDAKVDALVKAWTWDRKATLPPTFPDPDDELVDALVDAYFRRNTKRTVQSDTQQEPRNCKCNPKDVNPVCTSDGNRQLNACVANCHGLKIVPCPRVSGHPLSQLMADSWLKRGSRHTRKPRRDWDEWSDEELEEALAERKPRGHTLPPTFPDPKEFTDLEAQVDAWFRGKEKTEAQADAKENRSLAQRFRKLDLQSDFVQRYLNKRKEATLGDKAAEAKMSDIFANAKKEMSDRAAAKVAQDKVASDEAANQVLSAQEN